jgi:hypothetical protein
MDVRGKDPRPRLGGGYELEDLEMAMKLAADAQAVLK